jgi:hypothetical protein
MFGSLISGIIKVATLPIDAVEAVVDVATGGDGSKRSRSLSDANILSSARDAVCDAVEESLDK